MAETFKIGSDVFTVEPLLGEASFLLQPRILPLVSDLAALATAQADAADSILALLDKASPIVARACAKLPPSELRDIMRTLLAGARMNGSLLYTDKGNPIDFLMMGRTLDIWKLIIKALEVSYPDFFGLVKGLRGQAKAAASSATSTTSLEPTEVSGPVGA
jgi:hypothetical protein